ncbi:MAG: nicotinamide-nucleotide adenylyltransferase [Candidatus Thermoplasmatota archaeon]|nr:nicotinamide-nucleotide adenylyltransferase [Candidatus Thermoplasmatota archaeon]
MRALMVGRFQPFHKGHLESIKHILDEFDYVIIGIGSAQYSHTPENPFTGGERHLMISRALLDEGITNFFLVPITDVNQFGLWVAHVQLIVPPFETLFSNNPLTLRLFSERGYDARRLPLYNREQFSGKVIRDAIVNDGSWEELVPKGVARTIKEIDGVSRLKDLCTPLKGEELVV